MHRRSFLFGFALTPLPTGSLQQEAFLLLLSRIQIEPRPLKAGLGGHIVNISSAGGISPGSSSIAYSSSKAALNHLTRCLAVAMAPKVSVNCIAPGLVENTRMAQRLPEKVAEGARRQAVLGLVGQPEDIAEQTFSFVSSRSVTGQTIVIDGGMPGAMR